MREIYAQLDRSTNIIVQYGLQSWLKVGPYRKESEAFDSLKPGEDMVGLEQAFNLAAASEDWSPGE